MICRHCTDLGPGEADLKLEKAYLWIGKEDFSSEGFFKQGTKGNELLSPIESGDFHLFDHLSINSFVPLQPSRACNQACDHLSGLK